MFRLGKWWAVDCSGLLASNRKKVQTVSKEAVVYLPARPSSRYYFFLCLACSTSFAANKLAISTFAKAVYLRTELNLGSRHITKPNTNVKSRKCSFYIKPYFCHDVYKLSQLFCQTSLVVTHFINCFDLQPIFDNLWSVLFLSPCWFYNTGGLQYRERTDRKYQIYSG